jgi:hypothetical protein
MPSTLLRARVAGVLPRPGLLYFDFLVVYTCAKSALLFPDAGPFPCALCTVRQGLFPATP